jgi:hypothetical protein
MGERAAFEWRQEILAAIRAAGREIVPPLSDDEFLDALKAYGLHPVFVYDDDGELTATPPSAPDPAR